MTAQTATASTVPHPLGKPGGPGLFHIKGAGLPPYIENLRNGLMKQGHSEDDATQMAIGVVRDWKDGHDGHGHKVSADVQAAATAAVAAYDKTRAQAHASRADTKAPYGTAVEYADPGYLDADGNQAVKSGKPGVKRYPLSADKVMAAWSYINQADNAGQYTPAQLAGIKGRIRSAMARHGHTVSDSAGKPASRATVKPAGEPYHAKPYAPEADETAKCPSCGKLDDPDAKFCDQCGAAMSPSSPYKWDADETVTCPECKKGNDDDARFCDQCGVRFEGRTDMTAPSEAPAAPGGLASATRGELFRTWPLEECRILRAADGERSGRVVEAYAAVYGQPAEIHDHQGHYEEDIERTAFDHAIRAAHPDRNGGYWGITCLYNHGMTVHGTPAERFSLPPGVPKHISSEGKGLLTRTEYAATPLGDELLELVDMGALRTQSFTGAIIASDPELRGPGDKYRRRGGSLTRVRRTQLGLREYGLTPFAAYSGAEVLGVRMQLPGTPDGDPGSPEDEDVTPDMDGDGTGTMPVDMAPSRSVSRRLWLLRFEEQCEKAGITLPGRS